MDHFIVRVRSPLYLHMYHLTLQMQIGGKVREISIYFLSFITVRGLYLSIPFSEKRSLLSSRFLACLASYWNCLTNQESRVRDTCFDALFYDFAVCEEESCLEFRTRSTHQSSLSFFGHFCQILPNYLLPRHCRTHVFLFHNHIFEADRVYFELPRHCLPPVFLKQFVFSE